MEGNVQIREPYTEEKNNKTPSGKILKSENEISEESAIEEGHKTARMSLKKRLK